MAKSSVRNTKHELMIWIRDWCKQTPVFTIQQLAGDALAHFSQDPTWMTLFFEQQLEAFIKTVGRDVIATSRPDLVRIANNYLSRDLVGVHAHAQVATTWSECLGFNQVEHIRLLAMGKDDLRAAAALHAKLAKGNLVRAVFYRKLDAALPPGTTVGQVLNADDLTRLAYEAVQETK